MQLVCSLGMMLFHALEYGLRADEEHVLSRPFEMLVDRMTSADPEGSSDGDLSSDEDDDQDSAEEDCHDEGIEKDSGEDDPGGGDGTAGKPPHRSGLTLVKVLEVRFS